jgi:hypothetical protein
MKKLLLLLQCFVFFTAVISGLLMIARPNGSLLQLPPQLLHSTPFSNFLIPGVVLTVVVGGVSGIAAFYNVQGYKSRYNWAMVCGVTVFGFIAAAVILIQNFNWLHLVYAGAGLLMILTAYQLKGKWAV